MCDEQRVLLMFPTVFCLIEYFLEVDCSVACLRLVHSGTRCSRSLSSLIPTASLIKPLTSEADNLTLVWSLHPVSL